MKSLTKILAFSAAILLTPGLNCKSAQATEVESRDFNPAWNAVPDVRKFSYRQISLDGKTDVPIEFTTFGRQQGEREVVIYQNGLPKLSKKISVPEYENGVLTVSLDGDEFASRKNRFRFVTEFGAIYLFSRDDQGRRVTEGYTTAYFDASGLPATKTSSQKRSFSRESISAGIEGRYAPQQSSQVAPVIEKKAAPVTLPQDKTESYKDY